MKRIQNINKYDEVKLLEIKYGLEALYLMISKFTVYLIIDSFLGIFETAILFILVYIPIRSYSFGYHAKKSLHCWILSGLCFIGIPYISQYLYFDIYAKIALTIYCLIVFWFFSPADTPKRPLVNPITRKKLKIKSIIVVLVYSTYTLLFDNQLSTLMILALAFQSIIISPLTYRISKTQYSNYLHYGLN